jgi:hypothetical protein
MTVRSSSHSRKRFFYFIGASNDHRSRSVCANALPLPMVAAANEILTKLSRYVLDRDVVEGAIMDTIQELRPS